MAAIQSANLEALQHELARGRIVVDINSNHDNLLDFTINRLIQELCQPNPEPSTSITSPAAIARMGLWLISQDLVASSPLVENLELDWPNLPKVPESDVHEVGVFLYKMYEGQQPVHRMLRSIAYAVWHNGHLNMPEDFDTQVGCIDNPEDLTLMIEIVTPAEEKFWSNESSISAGLASIIVNALLRYERARRSSGLPLTKENLDIILQGPRTALLRLMLLKLDIAWNASIFMSNLLGLCQPMPLLADEFGDIVAVFALRHRKLDYWNRMLYFHRAGLDYLHVEGHKGRASRLIADWKDVEKSVRIRGNRFHDVHWRSVAKGKHGDFEQVLGPYVKLAGSEGLYERCAIFYELEF